MADHQTGVLAARAHEVVPGAHSAGARHYDRADGRAGQVRQHGAKTAACVVLVTSTEQFGELVRQQLLGNPIASEDEDGGDGAKQKPEDQYVIDIDTRPTEVEKTALQNRIGTRDID